MNDPDFWLVECDTFRHDLGVDRVACHIVEGPDSFIDGFDGQQWLVRTDPPVADHGHATDRVLVTVRAPDRSDGTEWTSFCISVVSIDPTTREWLAGHKMTATTDPDRWA